MGVRKVVGRRGSLPKASKRRGKPNVNLLRSRLPSIEKKVGSGFNSPELIAGAASRARLSSSLRQTALTGRQDASFSVLPERGHFRTMPHVHLPGVYGEKDQRFLAVDVGHSNLASERQRSSMAASRWRFGKTGETRHSQNLGNVCLY